MRATLIALAVCLVPGLACAAQRVFSFDADSPRAKALTGAGLTLTVDQPLLGGARLKLLQATAVPVAVEVKGAAGDDEKRLRAQLPASAAGAGLYEVIRAAQQGEVLSSAFCPGATRVWLALSPITYGRSLTLWAIGQGGGPEVSLCAEMGFVWRGEWRAPPDRPPPAYRKPRIGF